MGAGEGDPGLDLASSLSIGAALYALRQGAHATGDAELALQYLFAHIDVGDPQVAPLLELHDVPAEAVPAFEDYICRLLRPWLRRIADAQPRSSGWSEEVLRLLVPGLRGLPGLEEAARRVLEAELDGADERKRERWRTALAERAWPGDDAGRLIGAIGILQEAFDLTVSLSVEDPWRIREGGEG